MDRPLHLGDGGATCRGYLIRKDEVAVGIGSPAAVGGMPFAGLVPALHEIMVDVGDRRTADLEIQVVIVVGAMMARGNHRMRIEVDAADEGAGCLQAGVHQPHLLVLAEAGMRTVPANADGRSLLLQHCDVRGRPPERVGAQMGNGVVRAPEQHPDLEPAPTRS